jgi:peroxiredoxin
MRFATGCLMLIAAASGGCRSTASGVSNEPLAQSAGADRPLAPPIAAGARAEVGQAAPDFTLADLDGKPVKLSDHRGKVVVLEWFNPECPFVKAAHSRGSLVATAERHQRGGDVVWLAVNSGAAGKQGHDPAVNRAALTEWKLGHPVLRDPSGAVGRAFGAKRTPQLFVIDREGVLRYAGAIDNSPDAEGKSPTGDRLVNYVDEALSDLAAGRAVRTPTTEAYGCTVKYGS